MSENQFMTATQIATELNVAEPTVYNWIRAGVLRAYRTGGLWRIARVDFDKFLARSQFEPEAPEAQP